MMLFAIFLVVFGYACNSQDNVTLDRWETSNSALAIRVTEYEEKHFPLSKFRYVFEGKSAKAGEWTEIMSTINDDDVPIPRDQIRFINNQAAYIFMSDKYAITTNGGTTWFIWRAKDGLSKMEYPGQFLIKEVTVNEDGQGILILAASVSDTPRAQFQTDDFGHSWKPLDK